MCGNERKKENGRDKDGRERGRGVKTGDMNTEWEKEEKEGRDREKGETHERNRRESAQSLMCRARIFYT